MPGGAVLDQDMTLPIPDGIHAADYRLRLCVGDQSNDNDSWEYDYMTLTVTP